MTHRQRNPNIPPPGYFLTESEFRDYLLFEIRRFQDVNFIEGSGVVEALRPHVPIERFVRAHADTPLGAKQYETYVKSLQLLLKNMAKDLKLPAHAHAYIILYAGADWRALGEAWGRFWGVDRIESECLVQTGDRLSMGMGGGRLERVEGQAMQLADLYAKWVIAGFDMNARASKLSDLFSHVENTKLGHEQVTYMMVKAGIPKAEIWHAHKIFLVQ